ISSAAVRPLFLGDQSVTLRAEWVDLENVGISTVMGGVDYDLKVVVQLLGNIAPEFRGDYLLRLRVKTGNAEVDLVFRIENATSVFSVGVCPSNGSRCRKVEIGVAFRHEGSSSVPSNFGPFSTRIA